MASIKRPAVTHPSLAKNEIGLVVRDYEGAMSTLCAGCGHDSVTAAIVRAFYELAVPPHMIAKLSGIGCSSKTPTYFVSGAHGFNSAHGRMPAIATGANAANRALTYIGISGDGDSLSIGLGQLCHAIRRNLNMLYVIENNGVYGLTKGQFSASTDLGSKSKRGEPNQQRPIDPVLLALSLGASRPSRAASRADKTQLGPSLKRLSAQGFCARRRDLTCVTFNDHVGSTKSYLHTRKHRLQVVEADFIPKEREIAAEYEPGTTTSVTMHDGSIVRFTKVAKDYDPTDRQAVQAYVQALQEKGEIPTGLLYLDESSGDMHATSGTVDTPLSTLPFEQLCPGSAALERFQSAYR
jgi:2-oxoglutarate ferredoxin oxidoreductase subunit beta